jgi:AraC-like DNA-binding protein
MEQEGTIGGDVMRSGAMPLNLLPSDASERVRRDEQLSQLFTYLSQRSCSEPLSLRRAAEEIGRTVPTLSRHLRKASISWRQVLADWRLKEAEALRAATGEPLHVIAPRVGYSSASTLCRALRSRTRTNQTPGRGDAPPGETPSR